MNKIAGTYWHRWLISGVGETGAEDEVDVIRAQIEKALREEHDHIPGAACVLAQSSHEDGWTLFLSRTAHEEVKRLWPATDTIPVDTLPRDEVHLVFGDKWWGKLLELDQSSAPS